MQTHHPVSGQMTRAQAQNPHYQGPDRANSQTDSQAQSSTLRPRSPGWSPPTGHPGYPPAPSSGQPPQVSHQPVSQVISQARLQAAQAQAERRRAAALNARSENSYGPVRPGPVAPEPSQAPPAGARPREAGGWTGFPQPRGGPLARSEQQGRATGSQAQGAIARRYRHDLDEDFVPNFGRVLGPDLRHNHLTPDLGPGREFGQSGSAMAGARYMGRVRNAVQPSALGPRRSQLSPQLAPAPLTFSPPVVNWQNWPIANMRFWTALGGIIFAAVMLNVLSSSPVISSMVKSRDRRCQEVVQSTSVLSRQQLTQLLAVPERSPRANVQSIIQEPYCILPSISIRAGVSSLREAYPLEFDPETWIVLLYEGDEYAGYRFDAR